MSPDFFPQVQIVRTPSLSSSPTSFSSILAQPSSVSENSVTPALLPSMPISASVSIVLLKLPWQSCQVRSLRLCFSNVTCSYPALNIFEISASSPCFESLSSLCRKTPSLGFAPACLFSVFGVREHLRERKLGCPSSSAAPTWLVFPKITFVSFFSIYILLFGEVNFSHNFSLHLYSGGPQNSLHNPDLTLLCHAFVSKCLLDKSFSSSVSTWS